MSDCRGIGPFGKDCLSFGCAAWEPNSFTYAYVHTPHFKIARLASWSCGTSICGRTQQTVPHAVHYNPACESFDCRFKLFTVVPGPRKETADHALEVPNQYSHR